MPLTLLDDSPELVDAQPWDGLRGFAQRITDVLKVIPASSPVLLSGDWGSGKTTTLRAIERSLSSAPDSRPIVWFEAWRHEGEPALLSALLRAVWSAAPERYRQRAESRSLLRAMARFALAVGTRVVPELLLGAGAPVLASVAKTLAPADLAGDMAALGGEDDATVDPTSSLWRAFAELVRTAWAGTAPVILVDDLDRCAPDRAVALLDGIRLLVTGGAELRCNFVIALDRGVIATAIAQKMGGIARYDGNRYLEKIFPISFRVPSPFEKDAADLVSAFAARAGIPEARRAALMEALSCPLFANPRLLKRCVNRYLLVLHFETSVERASAQEGPSGPRPRVTALQADRDAALATWIAADERWPGLRGLVFRRAEAFLAVVGAQAKSAPAARTGAAPDDEVAALLREPGLLHWLQGVLSSSADPLARWRHADQRLRRWGL